MLKQSVFYRFSKTWIIFLGFICFAQFLEAAPKNDSKAALSLRIAVCKRALVYEKALYKKDTISLALVYEDLNSDKLNDLLTEFSDNIIKVEPVHENDLPQRLSEFDVVYYENSVDIDKLSDLTKAHHLLSVTRVSDYVKSGKATLGIFFNDGKIKILINSTSAKAEQKEFFGEILSLSEIIE